MFDDLRFVGVDKETKPIFKKKNSEDIIDISYLSSGEKQIVFRGSYLLKNSVIANGAIVTIDEPEIFLHPKWQKRVFKYYTDIFKDSKGNKLSQVFMATHSEYVVKAALEEKNSLVMIMANQDEPTNIKSKQLNSITGFLLGYLSNAEILFKIFSIYSIEYHQALFEKFKNLYNIKGKNGKEYVNNLYIKFIDENDLFTPKE